MRRRAACPLPRRRRGWSALPRARRQERRSSVTHQQKRRSAPLLAQRFGGRRVRREERLDRQLGKGDVRGGAERRDGADERQHGVAGAQLQRDRDVGGRRGGGGGGAPPPGGGGAPRPGG